MQNSRPIPNAKRRFSAQDTYDTLPPMSSRPLPDIPTDHPLPNPPIKNGPFLPRSGHPKLGLSKTPPPQRRNFISEDSVPPPLPPLSSHPRMMKSPSTDLLLENVQPILPQFTSTIPTQSNPPPLPPRKSSNPSRYVQNPVTNSSRDLPGQTYDCPRPIPESTVIYNVPRSNIQPSYEIVSESSTGSFYPESKKEKKSISKSSPVTFMATSKSMSLKELVTDHQEEFPLQVEVSAGYFGETDRDTFSEGDRLNIHFVKQVTVAILETCSGSKVKLPLNSATQFGILYNPNGNMKEASEGYMFKTVKELLQQQEKPQLVCATETHKSSNATHAVEKDELLLINEVKHGRFGGQSIMCTPLGSTKQKRLSENCQGHFTTDPNKLKLFLPEVTKTFELPLKAMVFTGHTLNAPPFAMSEIVTISGLEKETTLIATPLLEEYSDEPLLNIQNIQRSSMDDDAAIMFDIPIDLDVMEVRIIKPNEDSDFEKLYKDTRDLIETYDPSRLDNQVRIKGNREEDLYYSDVRLDQKNAGIELLAPESIYAETPGLLALKKSAGLQSDIDHYDYTDRVSLLSSKHSSTTNSTTSLSSHLTSLPPLPESAEQNSSSSRPPSTNEHVLLQVDCPSNIESSFDIDENNEYCPMNPSSFIKRSVSPTPSTTQYLSTSMRDAPLYAVSKMIEEIDNVKRTEVEAIKKDMKEMRESFQQQMEALQQVVSDLQSSLQAIEQRLSNVNYVDMLPPHNTDIINMSCDDVQAMLDKLNLSHYKENFQREGVSGRLLVELSEEDLERDLGMTSRLHRKKLIMVIQGKQTYQQLLLDS